MTDPLSYLNRPCRTVARRLLGSVVVSEIGDTRVAVRLTEVEAYDGAKDPGSHAFRGPTPRTAAMFGPAGHLYVYFTYGMHWCANVVTDEEGTASGCLLRAGEVIEGVEAARARRPSIRRDVDLARGPARLAGCLGITGEQYGHDLRESPVTLRLRNRSVSTISTGPRVGVVGPGGDAERYPWRFWITGDPTVSVYRPAVPRRPRSR